MAYDPDLNRLVERARAAVAVLEQVEELGDDLGDDEPLVAVELAKAQLATAPEGYPEG